MGINTRLEKSDALTAAGIAITWTANEPTAAATQTIADGDTPTVAELGQYVANVNAQLDNLVADLAELKSILNAGE
jgi:hypothetical protein